MICQNCYCEPCICTHYAHSRPSVSSGTTRSCILCDQANRKIEKAIEAIKKEIQNQYDLYDRTKKACTIIAETMTPEIMAKNYAFQSQVMLNYERISGLNFALGVLTGK